MKKVLYITLSLVLLLCFTSCSKWLDVNVDPDNPSNASATVEVRLPWIQYYYMYAWGTANTRTNAISQIIAGTSRTGTVGLQGNWDPAQGVATTVYQNWFLGAACNIPDLLTKAEEEEAWHYMGAALIVKAMGYVMMADLYGEMPYTYAVGEDYTPSYDNGDVIYEGCLADLEKGIEYLQMTQGSSATPLSAGDCWNSGDVNKWITLAYGLKARWLNNLTKTSKYDPSAILAAVANGPKSNTDNITMRHQNVETASTCFTVGDAYGPNTTWDSAAWGTGQRLNRWYVNLLTNFKGSGVIDPRADKLLPSAMYKVSLNDDGTIKSYEWLRDAGVNNQTTDAPMLGSRFTFGNLNGYLTLAVKNVTKKYVKTAIAKYYPTVDDFLAIFNKYYSTDNVEINNAADTVFVTYKAGAMYVNDNNPLYIEDIKYVQLRADALFETYGLSATDMNCYYTAKSTDSRAIGLVQGTGSFYLRPNSDSDIMTYTEMCFIKAEVEFRQGNASAAYGDYIEGIKSHFARMNTRLATWDAAGSSKTALGYDVSFAYAPMAQSDIDAYMASAAVAQSAANLTLSDIMMQKVIGMGVNYQNYNDMRRYNFFAGNIGNYGVIYTQMSVPAYRVFASSTSATFGTDPQKDDYYPRRWMQSSHETNYNSSEVTNSYAQYGIESALDGHIWGTPVWWDHTN